MTSKLRRRLHHIFVACSEYMDFIFLSPLNILTFHLPCCVSLCEANFSSRYIDTSWLNLACSLSVTASSFIMSLHSVTCCICIHLTPIYHITLYIHIRYLYKKDSWSPLKRLLVSINDISGIKNLKMASRETIPWFHKCLPLLGVFVCKKLQWKLPVR